MENLNSRIGAKKPSGKTTYKSLVGNISIGPNAPITISDANKAQGFVIEKIESDDLFLNLHLSSGHILKISGEMDVKLVKGK